MNGGNFNINFLGVINSNHQSADPISNFHFILLTVKHTNYMYVTVT